MAKKVAAKKKRRRRKAVPKKAEPEEKAPPKAPKRAKMDLGGSFDRGAERISAWSDQLGRAFGRSTVLPLAVAPSTRFQRIPWGNFYMDWLTGGGAVVGRSNRLWGPKDTGKTTTCLKVTASAQRMCRYCRYPIVRDPFTQTCNCACPNPRWWLHNEADYIWLPYAEAIRVSFGMLPVGAKKKRVKGIGQVYVLPCVPPPHLVGKKGIPKKKDVVFVEDYRNEPMRTAYCETEFTISAVWAEAQGVNTHAVALVGANQWAEQMLETVEDIAISRDFDLVVLDSTSMMDVKSELEKRFQDKRKIAAKAAVMTRFIQRWVTAASEEGLTGRLRPTLVTTSQVRTKGINTGRAYQGPTDGHAFDHGVILDIKMMQGGVQYRQGAAFAHIGKYKFEVKKNHAGGLPRSKGMFRMWLVNDPSGYRAGDTGDLQAIMSYARQFGEGFIKEGTGKAKLTVYSPLVQGNQMLFSSVGDCCRFLHENPSVLDDLRIRTLKKCMAECAPPAPKKDDE